MYTCVVRGRQRRLVVGEQAPRRPRKSVITLCPALTLSNLISISVVFAHGFWRAGTVSSSFRVSRVTVGQTEGGRGLSEERLNI